MGIFGGHAGTGSNPDQRDWKAYPTIFSGDIDGDGWLAVNARRMASAVNLIYPAWLDGLVITGANNDAVNYPPLA